MNFAQQLPAQVKVYMMFFIYALALGSIYPRLGDLQIKLQLQEAALGLSLLGFALGTQLSLFVASSLITKYGSKNILLCSVPLLGLTFCVASLAVNGWYFFLSLLFSGLAIGALEVVVNLEADRTEYKLGRRIMNRAHAFWSFGFFSAGVLGAGASQWQVPIFWHFLMITLLSGALCIILFKNYSPADPRPSSSNSTKNFVLPSRAIVFICLFTLSAMLLEGAGADWSIIFMRDNFSLTPFINGLAFILGALSQATCRFFADALVDKFGPLKVCRASIITLAAGALLITFSPDASTALLGFTLAGAGTACIFPLAMSAAAQRTDRPAASNLASLAQLSFVVFLLAPPLLGYVAEALSLRHSYAIALPLIIMSWFSVSALGFTQPQSDIKAAKST